MISLNKIVVKKYAYVKNGVIFDIKTSDNGDSCVVQITEETVPYVTVDGVKLYFNGYIEDGDTYNSGFTKTVHNADKSKEESLTYQEYYRNLCEENIADSIINNYTLTYKDFSDAIDGSSRSSSRLFGFPTWMFVQDPTPVTGIEKIDFTEEYYNNAKENRIKELALQAASNTTNKYGYRLNRPETVEDLEIEKIED